MSIKLSVITCSHNPRLDYLGLVVRALSAQTLEHTLWEYILVDNASVQPLCSNVDLSWHSQARHVREDELGLTAARLRGIEESAGEIIVFVDDDNVLDPDYLSEVIRIGAEWRTLGAFSGQVRPSFASTPPAWTRRYWDRLAIREFARDVWSNIPGLEHTTPNGAGLCVRREVAQEYARYHNEGRRQFMLDRIGTRLLSAGDLDLAMTACDLGYGNGLFTALRLTHLIPAERCTEAYLLRLLEEQTFSAVVLDSFRRPQSGSVEKRWISKVADQLRPLVMTSRDRRFWRATRRGQQNALVFLAHGAHA